MHLRSLYELMIHLDDGEESVCAIPIRLFPSSRPENADFIEFIADIHQDILQIERHRGISRGGAILDIKRACIITGTRGDLACIRNKFQKRIDQSPYNNLRLEIRNYRIPYWELRYQSK